jgi:single-stranded DNA-binding protein
MDKVLLAGGLTRDPEMRARASGEHVRQATCLVWLPSPALAPGGVDL